MNITLPHLLHLASPALPVGAYAYSQGLEYAIDSEWIKTESDLSEWISGLMETGLSHVDLPVLVRCYDAWKNNDIDALKKWDQLALATRETKELLLEDQQLGLALVRLLESLGVPNLSPFIQSKPAYVTAFAVAGVHWKIALSDLMQGYLWSWLENQVAAATKIVPLGQTQAQQLLLRLMPNIKPLCEYACEIQDDAIGLSLPGLAMSSALHEKQYSRLFRS